MATNSAQDLLMDHEVLFDGSGQPGVEQFLFYFDNFAEVNNTGEDRARALIKYLSGDAFQC